MKNFTIQKGLVCITQAEFDRLQAYIARVETLEQITEYDRGYAAGVAWASGN